MLAWALVATTLLALGIVALLGFALPARHTDPASAWLNTVLTLGAFMAAGATAATAALLGRLDRPSGAAARRPGSK